MITWLVIMFAKYLVIYDDNLMCVKRKWYSTLHVLEVYIIKDHMSA